MRGEERIQDEMFSCVTLQQRVPQDHPLREIRKLTDAVLVSLNDEFDALYSASGRASIAPEYVLRAVLLHVFYSVRRNGRSEVAQRFFAEVSRLAKRFMSGRARVSGAGWLMRRCGGTRRY